MVDIDRYGIPIRGSSTDTSHVSSDSFWNKENSDSLMTESPPRNAIIQNEETSSCLATNKLEHRHQSTLLSVVRPTWPSDSPHPSTAGSGNVNWQLSSPTVHQPVSSSSLSLNTSLQCSVSDLRLCLGLQEREADTSAAAGRLDFIPAHDLTESQAELEQLNAACDPCLFTSLQGTSDSALPVTTPDELAGRRRRHHILLMPSQNITQSAYVGRPAETRNAGAYQHHTKQMDWAEGSQNFGYASSDIDLSDISLRFSPFKSMTSEAFPAFSSSDDGKSSLSSSTDNSKTLAGAVSGALANKNNYFLTFDDDAQRSTLSMGGSIQDNIPIRSSPGGSIFASREGKMDDSGAVSSIDLGARDDSRRTSVNSNKMKCWTDVIDDDGDDGENDVFKEQSFIASLTKDRKLRSASSQKLLTGNSPGSSENLTSGYSTSSMNGSVSNGTGASAYRPQLLRPVHRVRQSPSLPLNINDGVDRLSHYSTSPKTQPPPSSIPRSRCSAPDLKFLTEPQHNTNLARSIPVQHPLSCPNDPTQSKLPFRVNNVEDWDSLRVLLPAAFQRAFSAGQSQTTGSGQHPTRTVSLPDHITELTSVDDNVCPTCFKMQKFTREKLTVSACDCSSSSGSSVEDHEMPQLSRRVSVVRLLKPSGLRRNSSDKTHRLTSPANLMEFSRYLNDNRPGQLVINLRQKQELVTLVKAAAMGLVGFRQIQRDHSDMLSHVIEHQLTSALQRLMEDGLRPGFTVWSSVVKHCSPTLYRKHLAAMIEANESLTTDQDRFDAFVKELLRLSDLNAWLTQVTQGNDPSVLRQFYLMDGFLFLANSVTKDLWDDLMDTLSWLSGSSQSFYESGPPQSDTCAKHSPRYQTSPGRQAEQNATSSSVKRLASKIGRRISLLPLCSPTASMGKRQAQNTSQKITPTCNAPPIPPRKMFTPIGPNTITQAPQPHLAMSSRWSEWALSGRGPSDQNVQSSNSHLDVQNVARSRKSPSMYDIRSVVV